MKQLQLLRACAACIAILYTTAAWSAENSNGKLSVLVFDFPTQYCSPSIGRDSALIIRQALSGSHIFTRIRESGRDSILKSNIQSTVCADEKCASSNGVSLNADKAVMGSVYRYSEKIGEHKISTYIIREKFEEKYRIAVKAVDVNKGTIEVEFSETAANVPELRTKTKLLADKIIAFYRDRRDTWPDREWSFGMELDGVWWGGVYLRPLGIYSEIAPEGYGGALGVSSRFVQNKNILPMFAIGYYFISSSKEYIKSITLAAVSLGGGYSFNPVKDVYLIPHLGIVGYMLTLYGDKNVLHASGNFSYSYETFYSTGFSGGCEVDYSVWNDLRLFVNPRYYIFLDGPLNVGQMVGVEFGVKYAL